eukprot:195766-Pyramimonas_sp.AAC.1
MMRRTTMRSESNNNESNNKRRGFMMRGRLCWRNARGITKKVRYCGGSFSLLLSSPRSSSTSPPPS